jgi:uncharacterized protein YndB with AHSA1/START domain
MSELFITRTVHIAAHRSAVWAALTEAELISEWFGETASIDLRVGGRGSIGWKQHGEHAFIVEEVDEPNTFAFRWVNNDGGDPSVDPTTLARFTLSDKAGGTELTVVETGWEVFDDPQKKMGENTQGWSAELDELVAFLEKQDSV